MVLALQWLAIPWNKKAYQTLTNYLTRVVSMKDPPNALQNHFARVLYNTGLNNKGDMTVTVLDIMFNLLKIEDVMMIS